MNNEDYYKAYDIRYKQSYEKGMLWENPNPTEEILRIISKYHITKQSSILDLGCGEGRDAINLLNKGYNILAVDYSTNAVEKCKELTDYKFDEHFKQQDIIKPTIKEKFDFIYSVCVLHMFVEQKHRNKFYQFIKEHLKEKGIALIIVMGDGTQEQTSNIKDAFINVKRININANKEVYVAATSCRIVNWKNIENEIITNNLTIVEKWISAEVPGFDKVMCLIVK